METNKSIESEFIVYEGFKDIWRNGFYTISTNKGYMTFPTKRDANQYLKAIRCKQVIL